jgi:glycosyltransferase involved in cell wall biosynthesis
MRSTNAKEDQPLVSVVITCYNNEKTILKAIQSAIDQSYKNIQIIVVDDFSKDRSRDVLVGVSDSRFNFIFLPKNCGVSAARNAGYRQAKGDFVTQLDGDDYYHPDKIENEVNVAVKNSGAAVFSRFEVIKNGRSIWKFGDIIRKSEVISYRGILYRTEYLGRDWLIPASVLNNIYFDEGRNLYEDWHFALNVARRTNVFYIDKIGTYYMKSNDSLSAKSWSYHRAALNDVFCENSQSKLARFVFRIMNSNQYANKLLSLLLNWAKIYRFFPI